MWTWSLPTAYNVDNQAAAANQINIAGNESCFGSAP